MRLTGILTAVAGAVLTVLAGWAALIRPGGSLITLSYDMPFIVHRAGAADEIRIVYLDEFEEGMLKREGQAALLDRLSEAGARAVVYDIMFVDKSEDPAVDEAFAAAIRRFRGVDESGNPVPGRVERKVFLACGRKEINQTGALGARLIAPTPKLRQAADGFGLVAFVPDSGFTVRELPTGIEDRASLAWMTAAGLGAALDGDRRLEPKWINFAGPPVSDSNPDTPAAIWSCSAANVLAGTSSGFLRDKIVIIGGKPGIAGAAAGQDLFSTPFHRFDARGNLPLMSGVELQANALSNLLRGNWLVRSSHAFDLALIALAGTLTGAWLTRLRPARGIVAALALAVILIVAGTLLLHFSKFWFPWSVTAFVQLPVALVWGVASHFYVERFLRLKLTAEQRHLRTAFARYLSPQMLDRLTSEGFRMKVGGEKVMAAMMFTDIESFTEMCQRVRDPERIVDTLNDYFHRTTGHIFDHDGVIIKFIGDAIFAAWGVPVADPQAPLKAARAAWRLSQSDQLTVDGVDLKTRIGVHYGEVVAGNIGTDLHVDYTLIGDAVNLASRLEGLNKILDTHVLVSAAVAAHLAPEFRTRRVGKFKVKGRSELTEVHELLGPALQPEEPDWLVSYHRALAALEAGDHSTARMMFHSTIATRSRYGDGPSRFFLDCLDQGEALPGGVVEMKEK